MSGPGLDHLPQELLLDIVKRIGMTSWGQSRNKLYSDLCLVKPLCPAATELLYEQGAAYNINYTLLLRAVLQHPRLGRLVRTIELSKYWWLSAPTKHDIELYTKALKDLDPKGVVNKNWMRALTHNESESTDLEAKKVKWEAVAALLLLHTPNITSAILGAGKWQPNPYDTWPYWWGISFPRPCRGKDLTYLPPYANLKSLDVQCKTISLSQVVQILEMETLETLSISGIRVASCPAAGLFDAEDVSNVQSLRLFGGEIHPKALAVVIGCCKSLHSFTFESRSSGPYTNVDLSAAHIALQKHQATLRNLELFNLEPSVRAPAGWSNFEAVETFYMDAEGLFLDDGDWPSWPRLWRLVPRNVKRLGISRINGLDMRRAFFERDGILAPLVDHMDLPCLRSLRLGTDGRHDTYTIDRRAMVRALEDRGIEIAVRDQALMDSLPGWDEDE